MLTSGDGPARRRAWRRLSTSTKSPTSANSLQCTRAEDSAWRAPQACSWWAGQPCTDSWLPSIVTVPVTRMAGCVATSSLRRIRPSPPQPTTPASASQVRSQAASSTEPRALDASSMQRPSVTGKPPAPVCSRSIANVSRRAYSAPPASWPTNHTSASASPARSACGAVNPSRIQAEAPLPGSAVRRCHAS